MTTLEREIEQAAVRIEELNRLHRAEADPFVREIYRELIRDVPTPSIREWQTPGAGKGDRL